MTSIRTAGRHRRRLLTGLVGQLLLLSGLLASPYAWAGEARSTEAHVRWDEGLATLGRMTIEHLPRIREVVAAHVGWTSDGPLPQIAIVRTYDRMCAETRARVPRWAVGVTIAARSLIVVRADLLSAGFGGTLPHVLRHEWVHLAWGRYAGVNRRRLPLWAEEGLAEEIGGGVSIDAGAALDLAVAFGRLLDFRDLADRFPDDPRGADLAYKQSRSWVRFVVQEVGWPAVQAVLRDLARDQGAGHGEDRQGSGNSGEFSAALERRTGRSLADWHMAWRVALEEEAAPWLLHLLLRDFQGLLLACMAVVAIGASVFVLRRRRRQIDELPDLPLPGGAGAWDG